MVVQVLKELAAEWKGRDVIPKKAVDLFVDIFPVMKSTIDWYSEEEAIKIMDAADIIIANVRECILP